MPLLDEQQTMQARKFDPLYGFVFMAGPPCRSAMVC